MEASISTTSMESQEIEEKAEKKNFNLKTLLIGSLVIIMTISVVITLLLLNRPVPNETLPLNESLIVSDLASNSNPELLNKEQVVDSQNL